MFVLNSRLLYTIGSEKVNQSSHMLHRGNSVQLKVSGNDSYTKEEKRVLLTTSSINKHEFVPFMTIDLDERYFY